MWRTLQTWNKKWWAGKPTLLIISGNNTIAKKFDFLA